VWAEPRPELFETSDQTCSQALECSLKLQPEPQPEPEPEPGHYSYCRATVLCQPLPPGSASCWGTGGLGGGDRIAGRANSL